MITFKHLLSHTSSIKDGYPAYDAFLNLTYSAEKPENIPKMSDLLSQGGKFYSENLFSLRSPSS